MKDNNIREAFVTRVVDGDTFEAIVDLKYHTMRKVTFRLLGVDTPERNQEGFQEATDFAVEKILNKSIHIRNVGDKLGGFGRYLAEVFYEEDGQVFSLNEQLLIEELAVVYKRKRRKKK